MNSLSKFIDSVQSEFHEDRLTYQKGLPTFHPETTEEISQFVKLANSQSQQIYITGFGNKIDPIGSQFEKLCIVRTDRLNYLAELVPEDFFVTVGAGYPLRELKKVLAEKDLYLPHADLPYAGSAGGAVATNLTGRMHETDVPIRKYLIMAEVVTPEGEVVKPGSICFKSVSGYDIVKVFAGSWGLLGLIVTMTFRVMPLSGANDFTNWTELGTDRQALVSSLNGENKEVDALYSRKIKAKFDPNQLLPLV